MRLSTFKGIKWVLECAIALAHLQLPCHFQRSADVSPHVLHLKYLPNLFKKSFNTCTASKNRSTHYCINTFWSSNIVVSFSFCFVFSRWKCPVRAVESGQNNIWYWDKVRRKLCFPFSDCWICLWFYQRWPAEQLPEIYREKGEIGHSAS